MLTLLILGMMAAAPEPQVGAEMTSSAPMAVTTSRLQLLAPRPQAFAPALVGPREYSGTLGAIAATPADQRPTLTCTLRNVKADPKIDPGIAREADKTIDPKMVRPSICRK